VAVEKFRYIFVYPFGLILLPPSVWWIQNDADSYTNMLNWLQYSFCFFLYHIELNLKIWIITLLIKDSCKIYLCAY
jgi:hypothetical protein